MELKFSPFLPDADRNVLTSEVLSRRSMQVRYLSCYLTDLGVNCVLEESDYYDWDYLAQYQDFYSKGANDYVNRCKRLHFFSLAAEDSSKQIEEKLKELFLHAMGSGIAGPKREESGKEVVSSDDALKRLQKNYCGFVVIRPLRRLYLGRTVLTCRSHNCADEFTAVRIQSPEREHVRSCVCNTAQSYKVHIAGVTLTVHGLAWQQQDMATGACGTVSLWSALQSPVYGPRRISSPELTRMANEMDAQEKHSPSLVYLRRSQLSAAIRQQPGLSSVTILGDLHGRGSHSYSFSLSSFIHHSLLYLRCGIPLLAMGSNDRHQIQHVNCLIGFRQPESSAPLLPTKESLLAFEEATYQNYYLHDDEIGPNMPIRIVIVRIYEFFIEARNVLFDFLRVVSKVEQLALVVELLIKRKQNHMKEKWPPGTMQQGELMAQLQTALAEMKIPLRWATKMPCAQFVYRELYKKTKAVFKLYMNYLNFYEYEKIMILLARNDPLPLNVPEYYGQLQNYIEEEKHGIFVGIPKGVALQKQFACLLSGMIFLNHINRMEEELLHDPLLRTYAFDEQQRHIIFVLDPDRKAEGHQGLSDDPEKWPVLEPFIPSSLHVAVPEEIVTSPRQILGAAEEKLLAVRTAYQMIRNIAKRGRNGDEAKDEWPRWRWSVSSFFADHVDFLEHILPDTIRKMSGCKEKQSEAATQVAESDWQIQERRLRAVRQQIYDNARLMSRFIGVLRFQVRAQDASSAQPVFDVLFGTNDSEL